VGLAAVRHLWVADAPPVAAQVISMGFLHRIGQIPRSAGRPQLSFQPNTGPQNADH